ncbi:MAG: DUF5119 domain-containing protein [Bacteroidales bacterium]|nr:DUF5119 domain-containing protein [Bacteroidales bacterium]
MRKRGLTIFLLVAILATMLLGGCQRRPLELVYRSSVRVIVKCIWNISVYPDGVKPSGITLYFFRDGEFYTSMTTANVDSCEVQLPEGQYQMYMISQSPEEFWKMDFENMTDYDNAATTLKTSATPTWVSRGITSTTPTVVENPEILYAGVSNFFEITEEMTEEYQTNYRKLRSLRDAAGTGTKADADEISYYEEMVEYYTIRIPVYPQNVVSQLWVSIYAQNADVLKSVRASTSGMAKTFELTQFTTNGESAIQIIDQWKLTMDDTGSRIGHVDGIITTFGLPNGEVPTSQRDSTLNVSTLLIDNTTVMDYTFDVGDKIQVLEPNKGYRSLYRLIFGSKEDPAIVLPDVGPGQGKESGMDATVSDWEEGETVEIPM